jgi:hypothetical protein
MAAAAEYIWRDVILGLGRPRVGRPQLGPKAHQTGDAAPLADSGRQLVSKIPVDSGRILAWHWCHWKFYEIVLPTIYRTSKTDNICDLSVRFIVHCSWTPNWVGTWIAFGLHLGDSNRINLGPPWLGKPCWTPSSLIHAPRKDISMVSMSASPCLCCPTSLQE